MADKKIDAPTSYDLLDDETEYSVTLSAPIKIGRAWFRPGRASTLKGKIIKEHRDGVATVSPIAD